ncbi:hypothetical protein [Persephonella sp. KM09-Lau-8]|uniref:hypothetical protein n=1 Tax=Persephonella sp. KM09-Lau-8 TaxID=1158345 RepID=UPI000497B5AD|nr:hypothetical protein [Persephonella sp. KM09-Lau-8]
MPIAPYPYIPSEREFKEEISKFLISELELCFVNEKELINELSKFFNKKINSLGDLKNISNYDINRFLRKTIDDLKKEIGKNISLMPFPLAIDGSSQPVLLPSIMHELQLLRNFTFLTLALYQINYSRNTVYLLWSNTTNVDKVTEDIMEKLPLTTIKILSKTPGMFLSLPISIYEIIKKEFLFSHYATKVLEKIENYKV